MKVHKISKDDALALSARSEDHFFDRKGLSTTGKQLQKLVVAFANADGGKLSWALPMISMNLT